MVTVPTLRFREFTGEWKVSTIGEQFELYSGNTPSRLDKEQFKGDVNWISSGELKEHYIADTKEQITEEAAESNNLKLLPVGTFIIAIYGLEAVGVRGTCSITLKKSTISQACMAFSSKREISNEFLYSWYKKHGNIIGVKYAQGTKQQNLNYDIVSQFQVAFPTTALEQQKLKTFIALLDERIATQHEIIEKLQSLIKGLNNYLHEIYGEEVKICLAKIGTAYSGLASKTAEDFGTGKSYITYLNVYQNDIVDKSLTGNVNIADGELQNRVTYGDALFTLSSETPYEVGVAAVCLYEPQDTYLNSFCFGYRLQNRDILTPEYMPYCFSSSKFRKFILPFAQGSTRYNLQKTDFLNASFSIPKISKQREIANLLYSISLKINNEKDILIKYQKQKEYLLRNMFI